jgi:ribonuclease P protein component
MTPPKGSDIGMIAEASDAPSAVSSCVVETMQHRPDFLRTAQGRRQGTGSFLLQGRCRHGSEMAADFSPPARPMRWKR